MTASPSARSAVVEASAHGGRSSVRRGGPVALALLGATVFSGCAGQSTADACALVATVDIPAAVQDAFASLDAAGLPGELAAVGSVISGAGELIENAEIGDALTALGTAWTAFETQAAASLAGTVDAAALSAATSDLNAAATALEQACLPDEQ